MFLNRVLNRVKRDCYKLKDLYDFYFKHSNVSLSNEELSPLVSDLEGAYIGQSLKDVQRTTVLKKLYFEHRFDLLGSGWIENNHQSKGLGCVGFYYNHNLSENITKPSQLVSVFHKNKARKIEQFISKNYRLIDWQKDIKSGYRWDEKKPYFYASKVIGKIEGVDIKLPWELSRLQHLPQLAFLVAHESSEEQEKAKQEFCNVCLDFFASNPTGMGVNWACAMDVAIRVSNLIIAKSLFLELGAAKGFSTDFEEIFNNNIYEHGYFIFTHLEYNTVYPERNNNHYLSNISGLIFCGAYLRRNEKAKAWLEFAQEELLDCIDKQFHDDGSNFEASTSYHRLSGELVIYPIAVLLKLNGIEWVEEYLGNARLMKLYKVGLFTKTISKPDGTIPQIGDNDSGRFFKIDMSGELITAKEAASKYINLKGYLNLVPDDDPYWDQCCLNHTSFSNVIDTLFGVTQAVSLEANLILMISGGCQLSVPESSAVSLSSDFVAQQVIDETEYKNKLVYKSKNSLDKLEVNDFSDFGLLILKCEDHFYCSIYYGGVGQAGNGGHAHADFGSYELTVDGVDIAKDPGTFLYTPSKQWRNIFRTELHNGFAKMYYEFLSPFSGNIEPEKLRVVKFSSGLFMEAYDEFRVINIMDHTIFIGTSNASNRTRENYYSPNYGTIVNIND